ncbi:MAG: hypothetical protein GX173_00610, partial [Ruminococcaceae bacterium]|nr:hypothetical protein [Oscillospiraceae bacterium]
MANKLKANDPYFVFDRAPEEQAVLREEQPGLLQRLKAFISSRYAIMA